MEVCNVCLNTYTKKLRQKVLCQYCPEHACKGCQQNYLLTTFEDPHCFTCKRGWNSDFMTANFPLSFRNSTLRLHRRKILFEREKAMLPAMQIFVEAKRKLGVLGPLYTSASYELSRKYVEVQKHRDELRNYEFDIYNNLVLKKAQGLLTPIEMPAFKKATRKWEELQETIKVYNRDVFYPVRKQLIDINNELRYWNTMYLQGTAGGEKVKREFMMRCPADECRGFLSTSYKCGTCEKHTCSDCLEVLGLADDITLETLKAGHTCKPENIESAKTIKKETRPCPKCGARIFKSEGCNQMWCTVEGCNTAFDWNSGHIVTGRIHNPHYYEWLRRNGGEAPREIGDIPCGGIPHAHTFIRYIISTGARNQATQTSQLTSDEKNKLLEIHRNVLEFEARLANYPARPDALINKEINVGYLMNLVSEDVWKQKLEHTEAAFNRKKEIGQVLQTFVVASADLLQGIVGAIENPSKSPNDVANDIRMTFIPNLESLRTYTNDTFEKMGKERHMAVPRISDKWEWQPARATYKRVAPPPLGNEIIDEPHTA